MHRLLQFVAVVIAALVVAAAVLVASGAQAQASCGAGKTVITDDFGDSGCFPNAVAAAADNCVAKGWSVSLLHDFDLPLRTLDDLLQLEPTIVICDVPIVYRTPSSVHSSFGCQLHPSSGEFDFCAKVFGDPPQFPTATGDEEEDERDFVVNCSNDGTIPGAIPATINTIAAKECACDSDSGFFGDWPDCACPGRVVGGVCACPNGERVVPTSRGEVVCISNAVADIVNDCIEAGWTADKGSRFSNRVNEDELLCEIPSVDNYKRFANSYRACRITQLGEGSGPICTEMFGKPPQFPKATGDEDEDERHFVANCSRGGTVPGGIPATINTVAAKECACDSGYVGDWPDCACPDGQGFLADRTTCGVCPAGQIVRDEFCACPGEQGFLADGTCGACPPGQIVRDRFCACPYNHVARDELCVPKSGDFGLSDEVLCGAFGGTVRMAAGGEEVCSGMDANDTFCIMDSADAFPCRGMFKHLQNCNLRFNRPALNPFFCGTKCGSGEKAVGKECDAP